MPNSKETEEVSAQQLPESDTAHQHSINHVSHINIFKPAFNNNSQKSIRTCISNKDQQPQTTSKQLQTDPLAYRTPPGTKQLPSQIQ
ncbi:hypothetical protein Nepgr_021020 [Nepenthes gracilis]|uniref:Uncharacterized protein n=1 Tax=Nepenthes gracilis TaxID=150966 RepID=A0AAD3SXZ9_NEPGR|nr:hypothetical protein Nepgr_021020 [Nepenthes gracilis]